SPPAPSSRDSAAPNALLHRMDARGPVVIAGAGALGSVIGGLLARAGWPVTLLGRAAHMQAVDRDGPAIEALFEPHCARNLTPVTDAEALAGPYAAMFLTVKAWDTAATVRAVVDRLAGDGVLICAQNGLGNLEVASALAGCERVLGARVIFGAEVAAP